MKTIRKTYLFKAPPAKVWQALVAPAVIDKWGGGPAKMDDRVGTAFELWGGDIHGRNLEVEKGKLLVQEWFGGDWPEASIARFTLAEEQGGTGLDLHHTNVPDDAAADIDEGWDLYYLGPIKDLLEG